VCMTGLIPVFVKVHQKDKKYPSNNRDIF